MTRYLLDTHLIYWWMRNDRRLGKAAARLIARADVAASAEAARGLAVAHADPFDRLLLAQARDERMTFLTKDASLVALGLEWVSEA